MLALLAIMGAFGAGIVVDSLIRPLDAEEEDAPDEEEEAGAGSLLDDDLAGTPVSVLEVMP